MTADLTRILVFTAIPVAATLVGGTAAAYRPPSEGLQSFFQHFAAGVVLAAVAGEVLPEIDKLHDSLGIVLGFGLGVVLLLGLEGFLRRYEAAESTPARGFPTALVTIVAVDVFIDGVLMGSSFGAGERVGLLVTAALTVELLFLGLSPAAAMVAGGAAPRTVVAATGLIAVGLALGGLIGGAFLAGLNWVLARGGLVVRGRRAAVPGSGGTAHRGPPRRRDPAAHRLLLRGFSGLLPVRAVRGLNALT
ncbi:hypothetical protein [Thermus scotoductus]|uniref:hypothetical protein n=1 Tax=Thermus scotoductus TaxID=37636 RepID=UPI001C12CAC6|nr:hypothetical protein [Thermus scotoductus]